MKLYLRYTIVIIVFLITVFVTYFILGKIHDVPIKKSLEYLPDTIGGWQLTDHIVIQDNIIEMLGVDDYREVIYSSSDKPSIDLYVSYFNILKEDKQFHSPKNCLIGSGSILVDTGKVEIPLGEKTAPASLMVLQKGEEKQIILYWFQCRGRIIESEYKERFYRIIDAIFRKRTDGAFVRITAYDGNKDIRDTQQALSQFASRLIPVLQQHIPGSKF